MLIPFLFALQASFVFAKDSFKNVQYFDCHDGDTCTFLYKKDKIKVRIFGIDAPEIGQELDTAARDFVRSKLSNAKSIQLDCQGRSYHRRVCSVVTDSQDLSAQIIENGFAWEYTHFSKGKYSKNLEKAKKEKRGIWKVSNPLNPADFRKQKKTKAKSVS